MSEVKSHYTEVDLLLRFAALNKTIQVETNSYATVTISALTEEEHLAAKERIKELLQLNPII
jgi:hypothetical protein